MSIRQHFNQAGDTIVEVMFAVAVVGMVIGGSYVIANGALRTGRFAQEQTEALKQAEGQIEKLKYLASKGTTAEPDWIFDTASNRFCVNDDFHKIASTDAAFAANCNGRGDGAYYDVLVTYTQTPAAPDTGKDLFNVAVTWDRAGTATRGNVQISYRVHNAPPPRVPGP